MQQRRVFFFVAFFYTCLSGLAQTDAIYTLNGYRGSQNIVATYDGGFLITATKLTNNRIRELKKYNRKGELLWTIKPEEQDTMLILGIGILSNDDIIISGRTTEYWSPYIPNVSAQAWDGVLLRINTCGEIEWLNIETRHGVIKVADGLRVNCINSNDDIWVNQYISYTPQQLDSLGNGKRGGHFVMNKYNADGDLLAITDSIFSRSGEVMAMTATNDGGVIICGFGYFYPFFNEVHNDTTNPYAFDRSLVMKYDAQGEIEWFDAYKWEEDQTYITVGGDLSLNDSIVASRASGILPTDSNTFIISASRILVDTINNVFYNKYLLYEIDINGNILKDTLYDYTKNVGFTPLEYLNDTTFITTSNSFPFDEWGGATDYELEVWKIDSRTWDVTGRFIDSNLIFKQPSSCAVSLDGKILVSSYSYHTNYRTEIRVINPETMLLDTIPAIDTNSYDYLCSGVFSAEEIDLPDDTAYYEPIGFVELNNIEVSIYIKNKVLSFEGLNSEHYSYDIVNILGQPVYKGNINEGNQDLSQLNRGVYIIRFKEGVEWTSYKNK